MIRHGLGGRLTSYAVLRVLKEDRSRKFSVAIARGKHLFPFRTEKLSLSAPMVLGLKGPGRVGRRRLISTQGPSERAALRRSGTARAGAPLSSRTAARPRSPARQVILARGCLSSPLF